MKLWVDRDLYRRCLACADCAGLSFGDWAQRAYRSSLKGGLQGIAIPDVMLIARRGGTCATLPGLYDGSTAEESRKVLAGAVLFCEQKRPKIDPEALSEEQQLAAQQAALSKMMAAIGEPQWQ